MFNIGDIVVSSNNGICKITNIVKLDMFQEMNKPCFLLEPVTGENTKVYIPVETAEKRVRKVLNKEEAMDVIARASDIEEMVIDDEKDREHRYKEAIQSSDPEQLIRVIKNMYHRRKQRTIQGKKTTAVDERYFKIAVHNLHSELAFALGCKEDEIQDMIQKQAK